MWSILVLSGLKPHTKAENHQGMKKTEKMDVSKLNWSGHTKLEKKNPWTTGETNTNNLNWCPDMTFHVMSQLMNPFWCLTTITSHTRTRLWCEWLSSIRHYKLNNCIHLCIMYILCTSVCVYIYIILYLLNQ